MIGQKWTQFEQHRLYGLVDKLVYAERIMAKAFGLISDQFDVRSKE